MANGPETELTRMLGFKIWIRTGQPVSLLAAWESAVHPREQWEVVWEPDSGGSVARQVQGAGRRQQSH